MNIYFDCEFTGLYKDTQLISMGLVSDDGKELYLEFKGINVARQDKWIKDNVLVNTVEYGNVYWGDIVHNVMDYHCGTIDELRGVLLNWLKQFDNVQLVSDVCHYDFVLFIDIFGSAFDLPKNVSPVCHDINQDIAYTYGESESTAFNMSREEILDDMEMFISGNKHNALYDAKVIKAIYLGCTN